MTRLGCVCCAYVDKHRCAKTGLYMKAARQPEIRTKEEGLIQKEGPCGPDARLWIFTLPRRKAK